MKIAKLLILALLLSMLAFGQQGCKREKAPEVGTQGIVISSIPAAPPAEVSKGQQCPIYVFLENKGSYDVKAGEAKIFLEGLAPELFSLTKTDLAKQNAAELKKANRKAGIAGGRERIIFTDKAKYIGQNVGYTQPLIYKSCYVYETTVRADVCMALQSSAVCALEGDKLKGAAIGDAPMQITSINEERSGQNVLIKFKIENKGTGNVYLPTVNCEKPEAFLQDSVLVDIQTEEPLDCKPTLSEEKSGEGRVNSIVVCKRNMQNVAERLSPITLNLRYTYVETTRTALNVTE